MSKALFRKIVFIILSAITILSMVNYFLSLKEQRRLLKNFRQVKEQTTFLENEKQSLLKRLEKEEKLNRELLQKNSELKDNLRAGEEKLAKLFAQTEEAQKKLDRLGSQFFLLKLENMALREQKEKISGENENLKAKLNSIEELKKTIGQLKRRTRVSSIDVAYRAEIEKIIEGNHGFIIKDGEFTYPDKVKIEVTPATNIRRLVK